MTIFDLPKSLNRYTLLMVISLAVSACSKQDTALTTQVNDTLKTMTQNRQLTVYKSPTCGCCGDWVEHMEGEGFIASVHDQDNLDAVKNKLGIGTGVRSCHTAVINDYVFEGHIPAYIVQRFLNEEPEGALGLSVPGMPLGSPGMEVDDRFEAYDVLLLKADGSTRVFAHIANPKMNNSAK